MKNLEKKKTLFLRLLVLSTIISILSAFINGSYVLTSMLLLYGLVLTFIPLATPGFVQLVGFNKSIKITRIIGVIFILSGLTYYILYRI